MYLRDLSPSNYNSEMSVCDRTNHFAKGEMLTLSQYNDKATAEALEIGRGEGYAKTKINVLFDTSEVETRHHDIDADADADYPTLTILFAQYGIKAVAMTDKKLVTYCQVKAALEQGYLSPLNHGRKQPESTPEGNSRKVVSQGDYKERIEAKKDRFEARARPMSNQTCFIKLQEKEPAIFHLDNPF